MDNDTSKLHTCSQSDFQSVSEASSKMVVSISVSNTTEEFPRELPDLSGRIRCTCGVGNERVNKELPSAVVMRRYSVSFVLTRIKSIGSVSSEVWIRRYCGGGCIFIWSVLIIEMNSTSRIYQNLPLRYNLQNTN